MTSDIETAQAAMLDTFEFQALAREKMRAAIRLTFATLLEDEVSAFIGAPRYQRTDTRRDQRNGSYLRDLGTSAGPIRALAIPRTRKGFQTQLFATARTGNGGTIIPATFTFESLNPDIATVTPVAGTAIVCAPMVKLTAANAARI